MLLYVFLDCFRHGVKSRGNVLQGEQNHFKHVTLVDDCQNKCQQSKNCKYFVYNSNSNTCNLKSEAAVNNTQTKQGFIFGPRECTGIVTPFIKRIYFWGGYRFTYRINVLYQ